jgi:DNA polymerase-4
MERVILHSDINACYANIELLHRPALREKAVVVGGDQEARHGIVLAKSELAKKYKIKTGMVLWQAKQACPELVVLPPNYKLYIRFARMAREIYAEYTDQTEPFGLDESWLDVTDSAGLFGDGLGIAEEIRRRFKKELGITVSIGVSFNKIFAKLGSDMRKPDAVTAVTRGGFKETVWGLPASDLLYIGPATERKLAALGIMTIGDVARCDPSILRHLLGKPGEILSVFARGEDETPVARAGGGDSFIKSIGNSVTCPRDLCQAEEVRMVMLALAESVAERLRDGGFECRGASIYIRDNELASIERQCLLPRPTCLASELIDAGMRLFKNNYAWRKPIRSVGIRGFDLVRGRGAAQLSMLVDEQRRDKRIAIENMVDEIRDRWGYFSIQRASALQDTRIAGIDAKHDNTIHPVGYFTAGSGHSIGAGIK